jgi:hypothetical protein
MREANGHWNGQGAYDEGHQKRPQPGQQVVPQADQRFVAEEVSRQLGVPTSIRTAKRTSGAKGAESGHSKRTF